MLNNQGIEKDLNLSESEDDRQILNNLAGGTIASDIALFRNNLRNTSSLIWKYNTDDSVISSNKFIFPTTTQFVFTNGDEVKIKGTSLGFLDTTTTYYVVALEVGLGSYKDQKAFSLSLTKDGTVVSVGTITADVEFIRKDEVTQQNIINIIPPNSLEQNGDKSFVFNIGATGIFSDAFNTIEDIINTTNFAITKKYVANKSIATELPINVEGLITIKDPANTNTTAANLLQSKSPGVYITDPFSSILSISKTRAYSSSSQPWVENTGKLTTQSTQVNIGDLYFENGVKIESFDGVATTTGTVNTTVTQFTHKVPIKINGTQYFVLVKKV
jgi:hypothetical protein